MNGGTTYSYDAENRLIAASSGTILDYDPAGRLWRMTTGTVQVRFVYDGDQLSSEYDGNGVLLRRYAHGNEDDDPLLWYEGSTLADRRSLQTDTQGSIVSIANADGTARTINSYDEYGVPAVGNDGRFQYTGQAYLPALGFYYYKARMYSSRLGRFMQTDPVGYQDQNNLYSYVGNDPLNKTDASGMRAIWVQDKQGTVTIQYVLAFTGPDAGNTDAQQSIINSLSSISTPNGERIEIIIAPSSQIGRRGVNGVYLKDGGYFGHPCSKDTSCGQLGGNTTWIDSTAPDVGPVAAHEISHNGDAKDGYTEGPPGPNGERTSGPNRKPTSDIMTTRTGTEYTQVTIDEIKSGSIKSDKQNNAIVCRANPQYPGCGK